MVRRVIFDTDPGVDDAMALFFLLKSRELELEAVTTVFGNVDVEQATRNALILLDIAGRPDIPVAGGAGRPLMPQRQRQLGGAVVHGDNGLGGVALPRPSRQASGRRAAEVIVERVMAAPGEITLIAVGPLTNIALATCLEPRIVENVNELIIMGGAATVPGNVTPLAEANFYNDPEAAAIVIAAGYPLTVCGLDVALQAIITPADVEVLRERGGAVGEFTHAICHHYATHYSNRRGEPGFPMYDTVAVAYAVDPACLPVERWFLEVETTSPRAAGQMMTDQRGKWGQPANANVCMGIDNERLLALYMERLTTNA